MPVRHAYQRLRRVWVLLGPGDVQALGDEILNARPSVRFRADSGAQVHRSMPPDARAFVDMADAVLAPGYDIASPDVWVGPAGVGIRLILPRLVGDEMRAGEVSTVYRPDDSGHVAFVEDVFGAVQRVTKPRVLKLTGERANVRIGPEAEAWWRERDGRRLRHESVAVYYQLPDAGSRDIPRR